MTPRATRIAVVLRNLAVRPLLAYELRGSVVQLLGPGTTDPTWTATPELLAEAIDTDLTRAEEKDIPHGTPSTAHALVIDRNEHDFVGACQCGQPIGRTPQGRPLDGLVGLWEQHAAQADPDAAWANALTSLHPTSIGAS
ncbi:hypothetical protein ACFUIY_14615 [Streptomyces griseorubiginosus]|uniref:hypothetical protein n=1 Tax=Streptomyces griseorubiginosus TaxID=67304 RepID=UPI0036284461